MPTELTTTGGGGNFAPPTRRSVVALIMAALVAASLISGFGPAQAKDGNGDGGRGGSDDGGGHDHADRRDRADDRDVGGRRSDSRRSADVGPRDDVRVEVRGDTLRITHPGGWTEVVRGGWMRLLDPSGRVVVDRRLREADRARLKTLIH